MKSDFDKILVDTFPGFLSIRNKEYKIIYLNDNFRNWIAQYTDVEPTGKTNIELAALVPKNVADTFMQCHDGSLDLQRKEPSIIKLSKTIEFKSEDEDSNHSQYFEVLKYKVDIEGRPHIYTVSYDITELYLENEMNRYAAFNDHLTGAYNRRYYDMNIDILYGLPCVMFDLDKFKLINDLEGHLMGDQILKEFVTFLKGIKDMIAVIRFGGDEFLGIFRTGMDKQQIMSELQVQREKYEEVYKQYEYFSFSFSIGIVEYDLEVTVQKLDSALYEDKKRNRTS